MNKDLTIRIKIKFCITKLKSSFMCMNLFYMKQGHTILINPILHTWHTNFNAIRNYYHINYDVRTFNSNGIQEIL